MQRIHMRANALSKTNKVFRDKALLPDCAANAMAARRSRLKRWAAFKKKKCTSVLEWRAIRRISHVLSLLIFVIRELNNNNNNNEGLVKNKHACSQFFVQYNEHNQTVLFITQSIWQSRVQSVFWIGSEAGGSEYAKWLSKMKERCDNAAWAEPRS